MLCFVLLELAVAAPFVTTWRTTTPNEVIVLPPIKTQTSVNINWGDSVFLETVPASNPSSVNLTHTYTSAGLYNVSMEGQILWTFAQNVTKDNLVDIVSWGDGFLVGSMHAALFLSYRNLKVSAPPNTQPAFLPNSTLEAMFYNSSFNSALDWDLANVTSLYYMFGETPLNQPITFRNTQGVTTIQGMFSGATQFNQPFHFDDASGLVDGGSLFSNALAFNQVVNLSNSFNIPRTDYMFRNAVSFNQPLIINTDSVVRTDYMFAGAVSFNQPVNFNMSRVKSMTAMFLNASSFNQPINFQETSQLTQTDAMFKYAASFNQPVALNTSSVTSMVNMFANASSFASTVNFTSTAQVISMASMFVGADEFTQDLSSWDTASVAGCSNFCWWCGLPSFSGCTPCPNMRYTLDNMSVCNTRAPTAAPSTSAPSTSAPSSAPSTSAPSTAPSTSSPSTSAPSTSIPSISTPSAFPSIAPSTVQGPSPSLVSGAALAGPPLLLGAALFLSSF